LAALCKIANNQGSDVALRTLMPETGMPPRLH